MSMPYLQLYVQACCTVCSVISLHSVSLKNLRLSLGSVFVVPSHLAHGASRPVLIGSSRRSRGSETVLRAALGVAQTRRRN